MKNKPSEHPHRKNQRMNVMLQFQDRGEVNEMEKYLQDFCNNLQGFANCKGRAGAGNKTDKLKCQYLYIVYWYECDDGCKEPCCARRNRLETALDSDSDY